MITPMTRFAAYIAIAGMLSVCAFDSTALAQQSATISPAFRIPDDVSVRSADIWSEGVRMSATVFAPRGTGDKKLPTILMAHGWGGTAAQLQRDAALFAQAGYLAVTFDYRGWGASDSRVILTGPTPKTFENFRFTATVQQVREIVDPIEMTVDWQNAVDWLFAEPQVDTDRIGLWGSSQSGGYVVYIAARDHRIKAVHSQVGAFSGHGLGTTPEAYLEGTRRARGMVSYPTPGAVVLGNLRGAPIYRHFADYSPVDDIQRAGNIPIQILVAEKEELFDNKEHGLLAYERYRGPKNLVVVPNITHYGIYGVAWQQAHALALNWFDKHLKAR